MKEPSRFDRRWIFLAVAAVAFLPLFHPFNFPGLRTTAPVQNMFQKIDGLAERSPVLLSIDFDPSSKPELYPMAEAILHHALAKNLRVFVMGLWITGTGLAEQAVNRVAREHGKENGKDFAFLGWKPGGFNVILGMGQEIEKTYPTDYYGKPLSSLPVFKGVKNLKDFSLVVSLAAGDPGVETWIVYGRDRYGFELAGGATGVMAPNLYPYLQTGQLKGLTAGMKGAAEYEMLLGRKGSASAGMDVQSLAHFLIIGLVVAGNLLYFLRRKGGGA